jgi:hypothetical protein
MKQSVTSQGKISEHFEGLGSVTREMVQARAREIAQINGRDPASFTNSDWAEAKRELTGREGDDSEIELHATKTWQEVPSTSGRKIPVRGPTDEQTMAEQLVESGVEEANHDRMLQGSTTDTNQTT